MAKARPQAPVRDRAIAAFKKAHPSCPYGIEAYKVRGRQIIRVRGFESDNPRFRNGAVVEWSYANNGSLKRIK